VSDFTNIASGAFNGGAFIDGVSDTGGKGDLFQFVRLTDSSPQGSDGYDVNALQVHTVDGFVPGPNGQAVPEPVTTGGLALALGAGMGLKRQRQQRARREQLPRRVRTERLPSNYPG